MLPWENTWEIPKFEGCLWLAVLQCDLQKKWSKLLESMFSDALWVCWWGPCSFHVPQEKKLPRVLQDDQEGGEIHENSILSRVYLQKGSFENTMYCILWDHIYWIGLKFIFVFPFFKIALVPQFINRSNAEVQINSYKINESVFFLHFSVYFSQFSDLKRFIMLLMLCLAIAWKAKLNHLMFIKTPPGLLDFSIQRCFLKYLNSHFFLLCIFNAGKWGGGSRMCLYITNKFGKLKIVLDTHMTSAETYNMGELFRGKSFGKIPKTS